LTSRDRVHLLALARANGDDFAFLLLSLAESGMMMPPLMLPLFNTLHDDTVVERVRFTAS